MNTKQAIAAAVITLMCSAAFAQGEIELQHFGANQTSTVSRAEVRAEVLRAQGTGELTTPLEVRLAAVPTKSSSVLASADRVQIRADVMKARADLALSKEASMVVPTAHASVRSREEVRAEARAHVRSDAVRSYVTTGY